MPTNNKATLTGIVALIFWATSALVIELIGFLPIFEMQTILFVIGFVLALCLFRTSLFTSFKKIPFRLLCIGVIGIYGTNTFFVWAFHFAPPEKVNLISYLWPIVVVIFSYYLNNEKVKPRYIMGMLISFYGIFFLLSDDLNGNSFSLTHWRGYSLSFLSVLCWSIFTVQIRKYSDVPLQFIGLCIGISGLISLLNHYLFEEFIIPDISQVGWLFILGMTAQGLAYYYWYWGVQRGNYQLLYILSFFNPILSTGLLVMFGYTPVTMRLLISCLLVSLGIVFAVQNYSLRRKDQKLPDL